MKEDQVDRVSILEGKANAALEASLITEFLAEKGLTRADLETLPPAEARQLRIDASKYATARLAEQEARARFIHTIHAATRRVAD